MTQNKWTEFTGDIAGKGYTNVYVCLYYNGSTAKRAVDDICLSTYIPVTITDVEYATFAADYAIDLDGTGITAYTAQDEGTHVSLTEIKDNKVPAKTPRSALQGGCRRFCN